MKYLLVTRNSIHDILLRTRYLLCIGIFFYASYYFTNWVTTQRKVVPEIIFNWEYSIPFIPWTIIPYWSLNILYAAVFFLCRDKNILRRYITHLIVAQIIAVTSFLIFPLQISWHKPPTEGILGELFISLAAFDKPYNQAPSLHIILTLVVGTFYWKILPKKWRIPLLFWLILIAVSTLTTYQHHFIDIPTGLLVGCLILWALPYNSSTPLTITPTVDPKRKKLAIYYCIAAIIFILISLLGGIWLWMLWVSIALFIVAYGYWGAGDAVFNKQNSGKFLYANKLLLLPYLIGVRLNIIFWLTNKPKYSKVYKNIFIGSVTQSAQFESMVDLCAEYPCCKTPKRYTNQPMLDLIPPTPIQLFEAARLVEQFHRQEEKLLVGCALGYGRSVAVVATWLIFYQGYRLEQAISLLRKTRTQMVLPIRTQEAIVAAVKLLQQSEEPSHVFQ